VARRLADRAELTRFVHNNCAQHVLGKLPANTDRKV
jgi:hypothetical protein